MDLISTAEFSEMSGLPVRVILEDKKLKIPQSVHRSKSSRGFHLFWNRGDVISYCRNIKKKLSRGKLTILIRNGYTLKEITDKTNLSKTCIKFYMINHNIKVKNK